MNLGTQYYRAPFPESRFWEDDFRRMKDSGLNTVQLWVLWGWVESTPGRFIFDDYDTLVNLAEKNGLGVILSTIAEVQPYWIHREVPGSEMVDHMGHRVISSNREECHFGITPGGCNDHPGVRERMAGFLTEVVSRYRSCKALRGWDAWNELRWNVHADGMVCYCEHTLKAFRNWLNEKFGGLDGLNRAWKRRYCSWEDVMPGKRTPRPYTEMMAFQHFLTWRSCEHGKWRYRLMKGLDPNRPVTAHGAQPTPLTRENEHIDQALNRGNDWFYADTLDGVGCSSFPKWEAIDDADFGTRVEMVRSAARGKEVWLSEVQGGRASFGFNLTPSVDAASQQRWIWNGLACGAKSILFWCWRNEVFGSESGGFGLLSNDGLSEERLAAMKVTGKLLDENKNVFDIYQPARGEVGVFFSPQSYYLVWSQEQNSIRARDALMGYCRALVRKSIPYVVIEEEHLDELKGLKVLILPRVLVTGEKVEKALEQFVADGGTLLCESECGAFSPQGFYRYPEDRFLTRMTELKEVGRRELPSDTITLSVDGQRYAMGAMQWLTPWEKGSGQVFGECAEGAIAQELPAERGKVVVCGTYPGNAYRQQFTTGFEDFVEAIVRRAGVRPKVEVAEPRPEKDSFVYIRNGRAGDRDVLFVFFPENAEAASLRLNKNMLASRTATDIISNTRYEFSEEADNLTCTIRATHWRVAVLIES